MDETTYFALIFTGEDYPEMEAINGGTWNDDTYSVEVDDCELKLVKGVNIFESPEELLDAAIAEVYKGLDIDIATVKENCKDMKNMGEQLHDVHMCSDGYTPYEGIVLLTTVLPIKFASAATALQRYTMQYAKLLEIAYL